MKTFIAISLFVATLITVRVTAHAADSNGHYINIGRGAKPCSTQVTTNGLQVEAGIWTAGFLSAYNSMEPDTYDITGVSNDWDRWIADYCAFNPEQTLMNAVNAYVIAAYPNRRVMQPRTVTPDAPQQRAVKNRNRY